MAERNIQRDQSKAAAEIDFLVGVVKIAGVVIAGKANTVAEITNLTAVAKISIDLEAIADISSPGACVKAPRSKSRPPEADELAWNMPR